MLGRGLLLTFGRHEVIEPYLTQGGIVGQTMQMAVFLFDRVAEGTEANLPALLFYGKSFLFITCHIIESVVTSDRHQGEEIERRP